MNKIFALVLLAASAASANVIGTDYQNFNPDISATDFTTVHSSETVKPCMCNIGIYFDYSKNTLTYSDIYYQTNQDLTGTRADDALFGAHLYASFGLTENWDAGIALPFVVTSHNDDPYGVSYFDEYGLTEVRPMTKYRFYGDDAGGMALVLSGNFNTIQSNPFTGKNPGPTVNIELAADTTIAGDWKIGGNVGYRIRNSGEQLVDSQTGLKVPFIPFGNSFIYSAAAATRIGFLSSDVVLELNGSQPAGSGADSVKTAQQALELALGLRHDLSKTILLQGGAGTKLADAQATPDVRAYAGINFQFGPVCDTEPESYPIAVVKNHPVGGSAVTKLKMPVTAVDPTDYEAYRWKIGSTPKTDCYKEVNYSDETEGRMPIVTDIGPIPDGGITLCAVAKNTGGKWQPFTNPTIIKWIKGKAPVAVVKNHPEGVSDAIDLKMPVTAVDPIDYEAYRWKIGATPEMNCLSETDYSPEIPGTMPIVTNIGPVPDGGITLCAVAKNKRQIWQPFSAPTIVNWTKKRGYELFRINASVLFDFDKDELQKRSYYELEKINSYVSKKPWARIVIEGHTDSIGTDQYNVGLSKRRSERVKNYMIKKYKWDAKKLKTQFMGEKFPVDTNATPEGRANNRRVEFKVFRR
jgi:outer membrane protein OmpA-like peptidoglycan-associated protein